MRFVGAVKLGYQDADGPFVICLEEDGTLVDDNEVLDAFKDKVFLLLRSGDSYKTNANVPVCDPAKPTDTNSRTPAPARTSEPSPSHDTEIANPLYVVGESELFQTYIVKHSGPALIVVQIAVSFMNV